MSDFIDVHDIATRNKIAVDGRVNPTVDEWNNLLTHIDRIEQENAEYREILQKLVNPSNCKKDVIHIISSAEQLLNK